MARTLTLTVHDILQAGMRLRNLKAKQDVPPGMPAPPFNATLKAGSALRALMPILTEFVSQEAALKNEYALRDADGKTVIVRDPNSNIQEGQTYTRDAAEHAQKLTALRMEVKQVTLGDLSLDDVMDVARGNLDVDALNDLLPILDPQTLSDEGQRRYEAYQAAWANVAPVPPPSTSV